MKRPEAWRLGAIEGQVFHQLARRMKRHQHGGARGERIIWHGYWLRANGEWARGMERVENGKPRRNGKEARLVRGLGRKLARAAGEWLEAHLPALEGPTADRPWVKVSDS